MSRQIQELETVLQQQITEHQRLLKQVDSHNAAMKVFDLRAMDAMARQQEALRLRLIALENRRRALVLQLARAHNTPGNITLSDVARLYPDRAQNLLKLRDDLKATIAAVARRTNVSGTLARAVVGHLNTVVRILAGAIERAGLYTKQGVPHIASRAGVIDARG